MQRAFVTGANGFIGHHLVNRLADEGWYVTVYDRKPPSTDGRWNLYVQGDIFDEVNLTHALRESRSSIVFHLAALADVRNALKQPREQVRLNLLATSAVLEAMREADVKRIAFTSSAVVYGDTKPLYGYLACDPSYTLTVQAKMTESSYVFPQQTSIYGAMKLASESLISAYCHGYGFVADMYRLVSLTGAGYRHGNLMDFYRKLVANPKRLSIFGTGEQQKYYIDVEDVIDAMMLTTARDHNGAEIWNVSYHEPNTINDSVRAVCAALELSPEIVHEGDPWAGDLPALVLDCSKLRALGWAPKRDIRESMTRTVVDFMERQPA